MSEIVSKKHRRDAHSSCLNPSRKPMIHFCPVHDGSLPAEGKCPSCHHSKREFTRGLRRAKDALNSTVAHGLERAAFLDMLIDKINAAIIAACPDCDEEAKREWTTADGIAQREECRHGE